MWFEHMDRMNPSKQVRAIWDAKIVRKKRKGKLRAIWNDAMGSGKDIRGHRLNQLTTVLP